MQGDSLFAQKGDSLSMQNGDSLRFPIQDRRADKYSWKNRNTFDLQDTSIIKQSIEYDPNTKQYYIIEKIGNTTYREPTYFTFDEFYNLQTKGLEDDYFKQRANALTALNRNTDRPKMTVYESLFDRIFGIGKDSLKVNIKPQGTVDITLGYDKQYTANPALPENARSTGGFDFNMNANVNVNASIGDKLKLPINYNTLANFDYLNQIKLDYKGKDDEIIKSFEAGNISFPSKGTLIPGVQNLFGLKAQLQFGKLTITTAIANQKSQQQNQSLQGGAAVTTFNKKLSEYDVNRNFLMAQYFRNNYNYAMSNLPVVNSQVQIQRMEVWVTNRTAVTTNARYIVAFMDLGEKSPYNSKVHSLTSNPLPSNGANDLYSSLVGATGTRDISLITSNLSAKGFQPVNDFEQVYARQLSPSEYYFNPQIGFLSVNAQLQPSDVLAVAYQYSYNGAVYQVGEFSQDVAVDSSTGIQKTLFVKLLKATAARTNLPIWNLMMKNVYSLDMAGISKNNFQLNVLYQQPSGGLNTYLPQCAPAESGKSLLSILNLDRLNSNNDPQPDGVFDYIEGFTVLSDHGKIIFPVLEPFGRDLDSLAFKGVADSIRNKYLFRQLYDSTQTIAQTYLNLDRFVMQGKAKGTSTSNVSLGALNVPKGSVIVTAGGQTLTEGADYIVDYNMGSVQIINQAIINSGVPINVSYENNTNIGSIQRGFFGLRLDYAASKKLSLGATIEQLTERPFFTKVNYGEDAIHNTMYGLDFNYKSSWPSLTRTLNKLPFYSTKAPSSIVASGEAAYFKPGQASGSNGGIYIDDFEGSTSDVDLRYPATSWALASTPQDSSFPEAFLMDSIDYGFNRAKIAWYFIESNLQDKTSSGNPLSNNTNALSDPRSRMVYTNELFPQESTTITSSILPTFDVAYYPKDLGPYNYESRPTNINSSGQFLNPTTKWGGIMRALNQTDFEANNFEYIEFWIQDPFIMNSGNDSGKLYINLGDVSEDILRDGKHFFENGLNAPSSPAAVDSSGTWGTTPLNPIQITPGFSNDPNDRPYQDVGFDGLDDAGERRKRSGYIAQLATKFGTNSPVYQKAISDPSHDDYVWYRDASYDAAGTGILGRYKDYNNPQGNSPVATTGTSSAATLYPDNEDLNGDNNMTETEAFYEYEIDLYKGMTPGVTPYISQVTTVHTTYANGSPGTENWYLFRVPIQGYKKAVGGISDFKSIRFMRMYLSGFSDSVVLRFATLNLVHDSWREFTYELDTTGSYTLIDTTPSASSTTFNTIAVNIEQNSSRTPVNYVIPPGIDRVQLLGSNGATILQNEQSMSLQVYNLQRGNARAVYKTLNNMDLREYGRLSMFAHAESVQGYSVVNNGDLNLVVRIGQDFLNNYYEIKVPLKITPPGQYSDAQDTIVWPTANNLDFNFDDLINLKKKRNSLGVSVTQIYREIIGAKTFSVMGNPNIGEVSGMLIGIENSVSSSNSSASAEMWVDELRLSDVKNEGAYAAAGKVDVTLADLGKLSIAANTSSAGWGTLGSHIGERSLESVKQINVSLNIDAGKLVPKSARLSMPLYASINQVINTPKYDPYNLDILLKDELHAAKTKAQKDSITNAAVDQTTIKTFNLTNVKIRPNKGQPHLLSVSNFDLSYSYTQTVQSNSTVANNTIDKWRGVLGYTYNKPSKYIEPFKKIIKKKHKWLLSIQDINFNLKPSLLSFKADMNRQFAMYVPRIVNTDLTQTQVVSVDTSYDKFFNFDRYYNLRWDLTRSINIDFSAINNARVDEPAGILNTKEKRDSMWLNFFKGGRNIAYQQKATISYTFPLSKLPLMDWISGRYSYGTSYNWIAASLLAPSLGNTLENSQDNTINGEFDLTRLYQKSRWLRALNSPKVRRDQIGDQNQKPEIEIPTRDEVIKDKDGNYLKGEKKRAALRKWRKLKRDARIARRLQRANQPVPMNDVERTAGTIITMLKRVSINYSGDYSSRVPGWMDSTQILGQNWRSMQPGLDYVFGRQPDSNWLNKRAAQGLFSRDSSFNSFFTQNFTQKLNITASIRPIRDLNIDVNIQKSFNKNYTELFKDSSNSGQPFQHLSPTASGGFSVSYIAMNTLFRKSNPGEISTTFQTFEGNRTVISKRLATQNPYFTQQSYVNGYAPGYGEYAQDVLIPAFLSAYTGKNPNTIALVKESNSNIKSNPFGGYLPMPNWKVSYSGLSKIPELANIFSIITITHAYSGTLSMNGFSSALNYTDTSRLSAPSFRDTISGNYVPFYVIPNVTMQESFAPLIGIEVTTKKQIGIRFEYKKARQLSLSLVDYQLSETYSTEWTIGGSYKIRGVKLPFKMPDLLAGSNTTPTKIDNNAKGGSGAKATKPQQNDLSFRLDLSFRDDLTRNSTLDQSVAYVTGGQKVLTIQPSIDYVLNNRVNLKLFFDQRRTTPYISTSVPTVVTRGGLQIRVSLAP